MQKQKIAHLLPLPLYPSGSSASTWRRSNCEHTGRTWGQIKSVCVTHIHTHAGVQQANIECTALQVLPGTFGFFFLNGILKVTLGKVAHGTYREESVPVRGGKNSNMGGLGEKYCHRQQGKGSDLPHTRHTSTFFSLPPPFSEQKSKRKEKLAAHRGRWCTDIYLQ